MALVVVALLSLAKDTNDSAKLTQNNQCPL